MRKLLFVLALLLTVPSLAQGPRPTRSNDDFCLKFSDGSLVCWDANLGCDCEGIHRICYDACQFYAPCQTDCQRSRLACVNACNS